jgi:hypothetical protein
MCRKEFAPHDVLRAADLDAVMQQHLALVNASANARDVPGATRNEGEGVSAGPKGGESSAGQSPKIRALMAALQEEWARDPTQKAVVFSQFTTMLDLVQDSLKASFGPQSYARLDGSMTPDKRAAEASHPPACFSFPPPPSLSFLSYAFVSPSACCTCKENSSRIQHSDAR